MNALKKYLIITFIGLSSLLYANQAQGQLFYLGVEGGAVYSWFDSPKFDNIVTSSGWGWNMGFFARYGKKTYIQLGFDWTSSQNDFRVDFSGLSADTVLAEDIKFHNFDFSIKFGWNFIYTPMFKVRAHGGPFIGKSFLFSGNIFDFETSDFKSPQWGAIGGLGFQFMNFIAEVEYSYHFTDLFSPVELDGEIFEFGSNLQLITIKVGFMF